MNSFDNIFPVVMLSVLFAFLIIFIAIIRLCYFYSENNQFSFLNRFPFEAYFLHKINLINYIRILLVIMFGILIAIPAVFVTHFEGTSNVTYVSIVSLFYILSSIAGLVLFVLRPFYIRMFHIMIILFFSFLIIANAMAGFLFISDIYLSLPFKIVGGCFFFLMLLGMGLALNPKLKDWYKCEFVKTEGNGYVIRVRNKVSTLAISLWINYLSLIFGEALLLVGSLVSTYSF